ncbi:MAG: response regulator transcription factor [Candidatus Wallacebacter cryptica]|nr:response regulator transcription factor [Bacillota bacterium]
MYKIMIVEDDQTIAEIIDEKLSSWGYQTYRAENYQNILGEFTQSAPHLVLLDINLPFYDGFYWCSRIRELSNVPIIIISSRDSDSDKIRGIVQGGDDYLEKPFSMELLIAKVQAALRRAYAYQDQSLNVLQYRDLILDPERQVVFVGDHEIELTPNESKILAVLIRNQEKTVSRAYLMKALWDDQSFVDDNTLTVNVNRLRKKLAEAGLDHYIKTVKGEGYVLK